MKSNGMKDNENKIESTKTTVGIVGFVFGVLTVIAIAFMVQRC